jgi:hypothetical protein
MTERDIPESWSQNGNMQPDPMTRLSQSQQGVPTNGSTPKSAKRSKHSNSEPTSQQDDLHTQPTLPPGGRSSKKLPRWVKSWVVWVLLLTIIPGTIGFMAMAMLLKLPAAPNCPSIFWPLASASVRLHCAQLAASKQTVKDLLQAIALVKQLPRSHPLRPEIDRFIEEWSRDIVKLASESFHAGKLEEAIATVRQIPEDVPAFKLVEEEISNWQSIWADAENIYNEAEAKMRDQKWHDAFMTAAKLLRVDNRYWASLKYDELNRLITVAREDGEKLAKAEGLAQSGKIDNIIKAIKLVESIDKSSYVYQKAQEAIPSFGRQMLELAQQKLDQRNADEAISIAQQIPPITGLELETEDFIALAEAQRNAWVGNVAGLETAIAQASQIDPSRPSYEKAQELIAFWQLEIEDVARLDRARSLALQGSIPELAAAITEAQQIPDTNPRAQEAKQEINSWTAQIQTIEDRPFLERAEQIALLEDVNSLQAAIAEASQITRGRALYREARRKIANWTAKIQRIQDQPILDQARNLASVGNLSGAITVARQIPPGRALSGEAQAAIDDWQGQIDATENWRKARAAALSASPEALAEAIRLANRVPVNSILRSDVNIAIDQWGQQILQISRSQSQSDILKAIETAKLIPRGTAAYSEAQEQIRTWRELLNPEPQPQFQPPPPSTQLPTPLTIEGQ